MKKLLSLLLALAMIVCIVPVCKAGELQQTAYEIVNLNGVNIEYGIYGDNNAEPLLLLSPNGGDMHSFDGHILPEMAKHYKVICVSVRGTGNSDWIDGEMTFEAMADDIKALLDYLGIKKTRVFGFSDGGNLGIIFTLRHQEYVSSLAVMGANINTWGTKTFTQMQITYQWIILCIESAIYDDPEYGRRRDIKGMMACQPNLKFSDLSAIKVPFFNIYGERDMMWRWHSEKITESVENAKGLMVKDAGHGDYHERIVPDLLAFFADK